MSDMSSGKGRGRHRLDIPPHPLYRDPILNTSFYDNQDSRMGESFTTSSEETGTTKSTVRTVNFKDPMIGTLSEPEVGSSQHMTSSIQVEQMLTDEVVVLHPRSLLILAWIQLTVGVQILVFGMICTFYGGCPYATALWTASAFVLSAIIGLCFLKLRPQRYLLYVYTAATSLCVLLTIILFAITAHLLDKEDSTQRATGWEPQNEHLFHFNRIVENTKIAMYSLHLILTPIHGLCAGASAFLLLSNWSETQEGRVRRGYYVSNTPIGHQTVLVPIELKQVRQIPQPDAIRKSMGTQTTSF